MKSIHIKLSDEKHSYLKAFCSIANKSMKKFILECISKELDSIKNREHKKRADEIVKEAKKYEL